MSKNTHDASDDAIPSLPQLLVMAVGDLVVQSLKGAFNATAHPFKPSTLRHNKENPLLPAFYAHGWQVPLLLRFPRQFGKSGTYHMTKDPVDLHIVDTPANGVFSWNMAIRSEGQVFRSSVKARRHVVNPDILVIQDVVLNNRPVRVENHRELYAAFHEMGRMAQMFNDLELPTVRNNAFSPATPIGGFLARSNPWAFRFGVTKGKLAASIN